jgi:hypothetical protein
MEIQDFIDNGFTLEDDELFSFRKELISNEEIEANQLESADVPALLFGNTGINKGFCIYTGMHFVWLKSTTTIKEAVEFAENIVAFEVV